MVLIAVTILLTLGYASASTIVKPGERIQAAIDAAKPGETIEIYSGTYQESLQIGKQIVLRGIDSGSGLPQVVTDRGSAITIKGSGVILEGIWAKSASGWTGDAGILVTSNSNILRNNMASGSGNTGILLQMCVNNTLSGNVAQSNGNEGIFLKNCSRCLLTENQLKGNRYGIKMTGCYGTRIIGNTFADNKFNAIYLTNSQSNLIERNYAGGSDSGLTMETCKDNIVRKNDFVGNDKGISVSYLDTGKDTKSSGKGVVISYSSMPSDDAVSSNNSIYQNNLTNRQNAYDTSQNYWDNGKLGNNYSDFNDPAEGCTGKKVCDSQHRIPGGSSVDEFPQAAPVRVKGRLTGLAGAVLQLFQTSFVPGGQMWVNYSSPTNKEAWAGIIDSGGKSESIFGQSILYLGQNITKDVALTAPDREGSFKLRMVDENGSVILSLPFNVTVASLNASPSSVGMCENIAVTYRGASGQKNDWIGMFKAGSSDAVSRQNPGWPGERNRHVLHVPERQCRVQDVLCRSFCAPGDEQSCRDYGDKQDQGDCRAVACISGRNRHRHLLGRTGVGNRHHRHVRHDEAGQRGSGKEGSWRCKLRKLRLAAAVECRTVRLQDVPVRHHQL